LVSFVIQIPGIPYHKLKVFIIVDGDGDVVVVLDELSQVYNFVSGVGVLKSEEELTASA